MGVLGALACTNEAWVEEPLLDGTDIPDVLVESETLEWPPTQSGNRFVRGWMAWRRPDSEVLVAADGDAVMEIVHLDERPRELEVRFAVLDLDPQTPIRICIDGEEVAAAPAENPLRIAVPAELPLGRVAVALHCGGNPDPPVGEHVSLAVESVRVTPSHEAGEVRFEPGRIVQGAWSTIELVRELEPRARLKGRLRGPESRGGDVGFRIRIEGEDGRAVMLYQWRAGTEEFDLDLSPFAKSGGLARLRFEATGQGSPGRWEDLRLATPEPSAPEPVTATPAPPKLVVVYVMDALRADALGHLGGAPGVSDTLDRLATEGATFTRHFSVAPNTLPSTKALFTGRAFRTKGGWKLDTDAGPTLAEKWLAAGYRTGAFSANAFVAHEFGVARGFESAPRGVGELDRRGKVPSARRVHRFGLEWLDGLGADDPAFLYLHTIHPHNPYDPPEPFRSHFTEGIDSDIDGSSETLLDIKHTRRQVDAADRERLVGLYRGSLAYNDAEIASLLEVLEQRYAPGEMLWVITSDHGEELFDHGGVLHGYTLYDEQLHIPMIYWWPGVVQPARIDLETTELDLYSTLRALVQPESDDFEEGRNLWPALTGTGPVEPLPVRFAAASSLKGGVFMARSKTAKLIWAPRTGFGWGMGEGLGRSRDAEYFFDLEGDPEETRNLAGGGGLETAWLRGQLRAWIEREKLLELSGTSPEEIDDETRSRLRALGYLD